MDRTVEEVKRKIDIVDFIGGFVLLKKAGRNFKGLCPFHQERTPSFVVSPDRQIWHCFGACQEGGDAIKFLMRYENISFYEALKELADKVGVKLTKVDFEDKSWKTRERFFTINNLASQYYNYILEKHRIGEAARQYLEKRHIGERLIKTFSLGYAPASWDSLYKFLVKKKYTADELVRAGLAIKSDRGSFYDRFRGRIIFPIKDIRGNTLGFSGRVLSGESTAKYVNTPETEIYHKRETLFGLNISREAIKQTGKAIVVEGEFDMISLFKEGIENVVAVKGSAVTKEQLTGLSRLTKEIILALDVDFAGNETTKRAIADAEELDLKVAVAVFDFGKDPDEAITVDAARFKQIIKKPVPVYDFIIDTALARHASGDVFSKKDIGDEVVPFIATIQNPIVRSHYIGKLSTILDVDPRSVESLINNINRAKKLKIKSPMIMRKTVTKPRFIMLEQYILSTIFQSETPYDIFEKVSRVIEVTDFETPACQKILILLEENHKKNIPFTVSAFVDGLAPELRQVFDELYLFDSAVFDQTLHQQALEKVVYEFKRLSLKRQIKLSMQSVETKDDEKQIKTLVELLAQVEKKLIVM